MRRNTLVTALAASLIALPASAQFGPPGLDGAPVMEELIARAFGGPPWWKVSDKDTTVYVLASPGPIPASVEVDTSGIERRMKGANRVILPPQFSVGPLAVLAVPGVLSLKGEIENKSGKRTLEPSLSPPQRSRFVAAREKLGQPETRYGALQPGVAAMLLAGDALVAARGPKPKDAPKPPPNTDRMVETMVAQAAKRQRVRTQPSEKFGGAILAESLGELRRQKIMPCFDVALAAVEQGRMKPEPPSPPTPPDPRVLRAWAEGDIRPLIDQRRNSRPGPGSAFIIAEFKKGGELSFSISGDECASAVPSVARIQERWIAGETAAIANALRTRGHAVAVIEAESLLKQDGVLDRLRRQGFTVTPPSGAE